MHKVIAAFPGRCILPVVPSRGEEELKNPFFRPMGPSLVSGNTTGFFSGEDRKATSGAFKARGFLQPRPELAKVSASPRWARLTFRSSSCLVVNTQKAKHVIHTP